LREGNIENCLIHYNRQKLAGPKKSEVNLFNTAGVSVLKDILSESLGVMCVVEKQREIYFIKNVKFHLDVVKDLGSFVEIEAIDKNGSIGKNRLYEQCAYYLQLFRISDNNLISDSYSDLLMNQKLTACPIEK